MTFTPDLKLFEDRKLSQPNNDIIQHGDSDISNNHYFHVIFKAKVMSSCTVKSCRIFGRIICDSPNHDDLLVHCKDCYSI